MAGNDIDPLESTSPELNRRAFVRIAAVSAGAGVAVPTALAASGQALGQAHPPIVPEGNAAIATERVTIAGPGSPVAAYAAWPAVNDARTPSVVVVMHVWGVDVSIRDVVRRLAKAGFAAIAPDLYAGLDAPSGDGVTDVAVFRPYAKQLERERNSADIGVAAAWLRSKFASTKTGIVGFCMGGRIAMLAAIDDAGVFSVVCPFYGPLEGVNPLDIRIPFCGNYGERDTGIPAQSVRAFAAALRVPNDVRIYDDAGHAFFDDQRAAYVADAAADAWKRTIGFLQRFLEPPNP